MKGKTDLRKVFRIVVWSLAVMMILHEARFVSDFDIFLSASKDLFQGKNIFELKYHEWYHYFYSVFFAIIIYPLTLLPLYYANLIWLSINLFFTYRIWKILLSYLNFESFNDKKRLWFSVVCFALIFTIWRKNIQTTQMTIAILWMCLEGLNLLSQRKIIKGSFLLALGINIKLIPIVLVPYLIFKGEWKALIWIVVSITLLIAFPALFVNHDLYSELLTSRFQLLNPLNSEHILDVDERSFHSLTTLLSTLFYENASNPFSLDLKRNIADLSLDTLFWIIQITRLVTVLTVLAVLRFPIFDKIDRSYQSLFEWSYILAITPLIFPHQQHYSFFLVFPLITLLAYFFFKVDYRGTKNKNALITLGAFLFVILNAHLIMEGLRDYLDHYKILTYAVLTIVIFGFYNRKRILQLSNDMETEKGRTT